MNANWTTYRPRGSHGYPRNSIRLRLNVDRRSVLSSIAVKALGGPEAVVVMFDKSIPAIAMRPTDRQDQDAVILTRCNGIGSGDGTSYVQLQGVCKQLGITESPGSVPGYMEDGMLVFFPLLDDINYMK